MFYLFKIAIFINFLILINLQTSNAGQPSYSSSSESEYLNKNDISIENREANKNSRYKEAVDRIKPFFGYKPFGYGGLIPKRALEIRQIAKTKEAEERFISLISNDNPAQRLYGLYGLILIRSKRYQEFREIVIQKGGKVSWGVGGCRLISPIDVIKPINTLDKLFSK